MGVKADMSYEPLSTSSHHSGADGGAERGSVGSLRGVEGSKDDSSAGGVTIYVMHKEKKVAVRMQGLGCTLLDLKTAIESECQVPEPQQRLIRNGKMLKALQKTLAELELDDESTVHLFPIPQAVASPVASGPGTATQATNVQGMAPAGSLAPAGASFADNDQSMGGHGHPLTIVRGETPHLNPWFQNTCREVQMWSMILMVLSLLTLTNNLSVFMGTGEYGDSALDKAVFILDTLVSAGGLYVGRVGMVASRTLETEDVKKYVVYLAGLCVFAIVMRIMWVFDVVEEITKAVHKAQADAAAGGNGGDSSGDDTSNTDDPNAVHPPPVSDDMITTVTMQATIISLIIIFAWTSCLVRAVRLRWALRIYERANTRADSDMEEGQIEGIIVVNNPVQQGGGHGTVMPATATTRTAATNA